MGYSDGVVDPASLSTCLLVAKAVRGHPVASAVNAVQRICSHWEVCDSLLDLGQQGVPDELGEFVGGPRCDGLQVISPLLLSEGDLISRLVQLFPNVRDFEVTDCLETNYGSHWELMNWPLHQK